MKWYCNGLLGYRIMSFTSIRVIPNDKNKPERIISNIGMFLLNAEGAS